MNCFVSYEKFAKEFSNEELMLQYKILFRRWDLLVEVDEKFFQKKVHRPIKNIEGITWGETDFILRDLIEWNFDYLEEYAKFCANDNLIAIVEKIKKDSSDIHTLFTYDEYINTNRDESVFDMFFMGAAPLLNVSEIIGQELPSEQVEKNKISLVLDEVGSGKSVSAIIEISKVINNKVFENKESNILIICPSMLREKWQNDIRRQLGRYSYVVKSGEQNDECFKENLKSVFFKRNEKCIFIIDNISIKRSISEYKNSIEQNDINYFTMWSKNFPWDFVVIDECHLCNNNYNKVRAEKAMFLTATPIVKFSKTQYSKDVNNLRDYANIMNEITNLQYYNKEIDPIEERNTTIDSIFVNRFREDFKIAPTKRIIRFEECGRIEEFLSYSEKIAAKKNSLTADHYAQDDEYLVKKYNEIFNENVNINMNSKCDKLKEIIRNENKSFIVFCEHKEVVDSIYAALKSEFKNITIAKKYGDTESLDEGSCKAGMLIDQLRQKIRSGGKVILIITAKTGGTGLNLGDFDGVIHYELPYTSIQLEQRYGRIDRVGDNKVVKPKEMIFMVNKVNSKLLDTDIIEKENTEGNMKVNSFESEFYKYNKMLLYCVVKINKTCKFLPVRNTVLFEPTMVKKIQQVYLSKLQDLLEQDAFTKASEVKSEYDNAYSSLKTKCSDGEKIEEQLEEWVKNCELLRDNELKKIIKTFIDSKERLKSYNRIFAEYRKIENELKPLLVMFTDETVTMSDEDYEVETMEEIDDDEQDNGIVNDVDGQTGDTVLEKKEEHKYPSVSDVEHLILVIGKINCNKFKDELANGVFYFDKNGNFRSGVVENFREKKGE